MRIRGQRRCTACDHRWSYAETGTAACPACGSLRSVAVDDERRLHTDSPADLDLSGARSMLDERPLSEVAEAARSTAREYVRSRGFVADGELSPLDDRFVAAAEFAYAADHLRRSMAADERTEASFLALLDGAEDGDRPETMPAALRAARGLAAVEAVEAYRRDVDRWTDEHPHPEIRSVVDGLRAHEKRVAALDGDVPPAEAEALVAATRDLGRYLREGDETALATAEDRLGRLG